MHPTDSFNEQLVRLTQKVHCSNCGKLDPQIIHYSENDKAGYTECCQDSICRHDKQYIFGNDKFSLKACCWAVAELKLKKQGVNIHQQNEMNRFNIDPMDGYE